MAINFRDKVAAMMFKKHATECDCTRVAIYEETMHFTSNIHLNEPDYLKNIKVVTLEGCFENLGEFKKHVEASANQLGRFGLVLNPAPTQLQPELIKEHLPLVLAKVFLKALIGANEIVPMTANWETAPGMVVFKLLNCGGEK